MATLGGKVGTYYPNDLVITIKDHKASINKPEPYVVSLPVDWANKTASTMPSENTKGDYDNVLVVDTKNEFSLDKYNSYKTFAWLTKDSVVITDNKGIRVMPLSNVTDLVLDKTKVNDFVTLGTSFFAKLVYLLPLALLLVVYLALIGKLVYLLFGALIIWIISKVKGWGLNYGKSYQIGLHAITLPIIINALVGVLGIIFGFSLPPSAFSAIFVVVVLVNLNKFSVPVLA